MKILPILFLLVLLAACAPTMTEVLGPTDTPAPPKTPAPTATLPPSPTPTESPEEAAAQIAQNVLDGTLTLGELNTEERESVYEILQQMEFSVLAQAVLHEKINLETIAADWDVNQRMALSETMMAELNEREKQPPVLINIPYEHRDNPIPSNGIKRVLTEIKSQSDLTGYGWRELPINLEEAQYWWKDLKEVSEKDFVYPTRFIPAVEMNGVIHFIGPNGEEFTIDGTIPDSEEAKELAMSIMNKVAAGQSDRYIERTESKYRVDFIAGILYQLPSENPIVWNIDKVGNPGSNPIIATPKRNAGGDLLGMELQHVEFGLANVYLQTDSGVRGINSVRANEFERRLNPHIGMPIILAGEYPLDLNVRKYFLPTEGVGFECTEQTAICLHRGDTMWFPNSFRQD
jgi:hypothetical protein